MHDHAALTPDRFADLALPHRQTLFAGAVRLTCNEGDAEDLVQETLLKGLANVDKFQVGTNMRAWLFRIMTNTFINGYRRKRKEREILDREGSHLGASRLYGPGRVWAHRNPEGAYVSGSLSRTVVGAIEQVPEKFRVVVLLADLMDFSYAEIAEIVGCPVGTVMSRLFRGRQHLRRRLETYAVEQHILPAALPMAA
jgi:RNA polymerase sigma-70 factor (ECF subfamily)